MDKDIKSKVREKLKLLDEFEEDKIERSISSVKMVDGKIQATFEISGLLPKDKGKGRNEIQSYRHSSKIFDTLEEFNDYVKNFFEAPIE